MNVLLWHVHGSWTTALVQGKHRYLVPVTPDRGSYGRGRARTYPWPATVEEVPPERLVNEDVDVVILQRPEELTLAGRWSGRHVGRDLPAVYVEHNTPRAEVPNTRHPFADRDDVMIVHVTHFNALFWDCGHTRTTVIEHGVPEPSARYTGELPRLAAAINEPVRRWRVAGTDLLPRFVAAAPLDVYGIGVAGLPQCLGIGPDRLSVLDDPPQAVMHHELSRRRAYLHPFRWTSLGLTLIESMAMGVPVLALATTEAAAAVPADAGIVTTKVDTLVEAVHWVIEEPDAARLMGERGRQAALTRYGLERFLADWDRLLEEETCASR
ncbi:MAG TPA: glycosyltransferase [Micromonosporaceae bacterium]|jgi:glycosyltransferase involved in cell wall biosynthesis